MHASPWLSYWLVFCAISFVVGIACRDEKVLLMKIFGPLTGTIAFLGSMMVIMSWYIVHYSPVGNFIMNFDDETETMLQVQVFVNVALYSLAIISLGIGYWLRQKFN